MCLPGKPFKIEREWEHAGLQCVVTQNSEAAHRCGYVRVPPGHPLHGHGWPLAEIDAHGGVNFAELEPCTEHPDGQGWWFGFDCAHAFDQKYDLSADPAALSPEAAFMVRFAKEHLTAFGGHHWTEEEVAAETNELAEQLAACAVKG